MATRFLRLPEILALTGLARSTIYSMIQQGTFPKPIRLSERAVAWRDCDYEDWAKRRAEVPSDKR